MVVSLRQILARIIWGAINIWDAVWYDLHPDKNAFWDDVKPDWQTVNWAPIPKFVKSYA